MAAGVGVGNNQEDALGVIFFECPFYILLGLPLDLLVLGGLVEDDQHARTLEDSVFYHLVTVSVHVTFVYLRRHTFYPCAPLHVYHVWRSA